MGNRDRLLGFSAEEHPVGLQLGGSDPRRLAEAAAIGEGFGYDEINLNVGCPSDRVQEGRFGACLMAEPALVADCVAAMRARVGVPVTVKCRIGIDDQDSEADLERFIATVAGAGCRTFIVHARKAWLEGLSPKENRELPPLDHPRVWRLKAAHPELEIVINGGIASLAEAEAHLAHVDGVALGRAAYQNPYLLAEVGWPAVRGGGAGPHAARRARAAPPLRRAACAQRRAAQQHRAACAGPLPRPAAGARLPPPSLRAGDPARRGRRGAGRGDPHCRRRRGGGPGGGGVTLSAASPTRIVRRPQLG